MSHWVHELFGVSAGLPDPCESGKNSAYQYKTFNEWWEKTPRADWMIWAVAALHMKHCHAASLEAVARSLGFQPWAIVHGEAPTAEYGRNQKSAWFFQAEMIRVALPDPTLWQIPERGLHRRWWYPLFDACYPSAMTFRLLRDKTGSLNNWWTQQYRSDVMVMALVGSKVRAYNTVWFQAVAADLGVSRPFGGTVVIPLSKLEPKVSARLKREAVMLKKELPDPNRYKLPDMRAGWRRPERGPA